MITYSYGDQEKIYKESKKWKYNWIAERTNKWRRKTITRKRKNTTGIPDFEIQCLARALLPAIRELFETENENEAEYYEDTQETESDNENENIPV